MISKTVDIGHGWKVRMIKTKDMITFERYRTKKQAEKYGYKASHDYVQLFDDEKSNALTVFLEFIQQIQEKKNAT